jgi:hypothetical protein
MPTIEEIIESRGGVFLEELKTQGKGRKRTSIRFICENGHESIKRKEAFEKTWCYECQKNSIEDAYNLAIEKGFKFLSIEYKNNSTKYLWECSEGHQWKATYANIFNGRGCPTCIGRPNISYGKVPFNYFVDLITKKEGTILTLESEYKNTNTKIKYLCKEQHECETEGAELRRGTWCYECQTSLYERTCRKIFEYLFDKPFLKSRHLKNPETNKGIELDGYKLNKNYVKKMKLN